MTVNICGIPHKVKYVDDVFNSDALHFGQINYNSAEIILNEASSEEVAKETLCHEMMHGILVHLGQVELSENETLVQALGNAIYNGFEVKDIEK